MHQNGDKRKRKRMIKQPNISVLEAFLNALKLHPILQKLILHQTYPTYRISYNSFK